MAEYRIGPTGLFTPGDLHADADTLNGQIQALDDAKSSHGGRLSPTSIAFLKFLNEWNQFYYNTFGGFFDDLAAALNNDNRDQLIQFENRFQVFASDLSKEGIVVPGGIIQTPKGDGGLFGPVKDLFAGLGAGFKWLIVGGIVAIVGYAVWKGMNK